MTEWPKQTEAHSSYIHKWKRIHPPAGNIPEDASQKTSEKSLVAFRSYEESADLSAILAAKQKLPRGSETAAFDRWGESGRRRFGICGACFTS